MKNDISNGNLLTALRNGYVRKTIAPVKREIDHKGSRSKVVKVEVQVPKVKNFKKAVEHMFPQQIPLIIIIIIIIIITKK